MASPGPPLKKSRRLKGKTKVKEEDDITHPPTADTQEEGRARVKKKMSKRAKAERLGADDGEAGPSTQPQPVRRAAAVQHEHLATPDELAQTIRQRDFYKAEAEEAGNASLSETEKEQLIGAVMRYMLFRQKQKPDQPVRREELAKTFQSAGKHTAGASSYVIAQARARFASALGLEMKTVELIPNKMAGKPQAELRGLDVKGAKAYILRSLLPPKCRAIVKAPDVYYGFFMLVLSQIGFSPSKKIPAEVLWDCLDGLCLHEREAHPTLGKPEELLALMLKKRYIMEIIPGASDGPTRLYCAGENALDEIRQEEMDLFAAKVLRDAAIEIPDEPSTEAED